ncbi:MAG: hypothetical protein JXM73_14230 [Anaerolineae bacterium]|nr:hypothetical protein [Anaerolineae bacterium]
MAETDPDAVRFLSWGAGLQSTVLGEMSARGDLPRCIVLHCDLGWERQRTVEIREFYSARWRAMGLDVHILDVGDIRALGAAEHVHIPFWTNEGGMLRRKCTQHFKIRPMRRKVRELLGYDPSRPPAPPPGSAVMWLGITTDEWTRASKIISQRDQVQYMVNRFPLLGLGMDRAACAAWLADRGLPAPIRSACVCCPYRRASEWIAMREQAPGEFEAACAFDELNRRNVLAKNEGVESDELYIWEGQEPLRTAGLAAVAAREKRIYGNQLPMFACESGYCGV